MSPGEMARRGRDQVVKVAWRRLQGHSGNGRPVSASGIVASPFATPLPPQTAALVPTHARDAVIEAAELLLASRWKVFSLMRSDLGPEPDWFLDISTGRRAPDQAYALGIDLRDSAAVGQVKYVWELARHQHLTVLASAYHLTADDRYAERIREHLVSWWQRNPFLTGIHWTSGIELGVRLLSWIWLRRLLAGWHDVQALFERNPVFIGQLFAHQRYLAGLPSHHSSANNHLLAEAAGQFASSCAFPYFDQSGTWRAGAAEVLRRELATQTFPCGSNRELATEYHLFVLELCLTAAIEGEAAGFGLGDVVWDTLARMLDALAAMVDARLRPPRQGDGDDAHGLLLDAPTYDRVSSLLATGRVLVGEQPWWPRVEHRDNRTIYWTALMHRRIAARPRTASRPALLAEAGSAFLRAEEGTDQEIWCRCDHGPLGFLSTAAHGHADALSVEVRLGGVDVLADPGTYCYQGSQMWRRYFRSTRAHNTLELGGVSQSVDGGPFLWLRHASCRLLGVTGLGAGSTAVWQAEHDGYGRLIPPAVHRRRVELDRRWRRLEITDTVDCVGEHECVLSFHLGPEVECLLSGAVAELRWPGRSGVDGATLELPVELEWQAARGQENPPLGWYSPGFDVKQPATTLFGCGRIGHGASLRSTLAFRATTASDTPRGNAKPWT
jgi:hypothetical protein